MRRQYWNTRLEDRQKVPCACRQGRIGISLYTDVHTGRWSHRRGFRSVYSVKAAVAWQRFVLSYSMHSPPALPTESPWVGRRFESIRINRGEKDEHCGRVFSSVSILSRFSSERATLEHLFRPFHLSLSVLYTRCPRRLTFSSNQSYLQSYREQSRLFRRSLSCEWSEFEDLRRNTNELSESYGRNAFKNLREILNFN